jgi:hypothetical protein
LLVISCIVNWVCSLIYKICSWRHTWRLLIVDLPAEIPKQNYSYYYILWFHIPNTPSVVNLYCIIWITNGIINIIDYEFSLIPSPFGENALWTTTDPQDNTVPPQPVFTVNTTLIGRGKATYFIFKCNTAPTANTFPSKTTWTINIDPSSNLLEILLVMFCSNRLL